jgi:hypothetical protein
MSENLIEMNVLQNFIELLIWTGQLSDERPVSAIIVAPAGAGKTTLLESIKCAQADFVGDLTARQLSGLATASKEVTHVLLGDMLSLFGHKSSTVKLTLRLVSQMTGETLGHDPWTGTPLKEPKQVGLITAIPPDDFKKERKHIEEGGFASRFMIVRYAYKPSTIANIHRFIAHNGYAGIKSKPFFIKDPGKWEVRIPARIAEKIKDFGQTLRIDPLGFRAHRHLRALVKAQARRHSRPVVAIKDFAYVQSCCEFFSKDGREI